MTDVIKNFIVFINGNTMAKILICMLLVAFACYMAYSLGAGIGKTIYYFTHPQ
jgi:hypothetical protein